MATATVQTTLQRGVIEDAQAQAQDWLRNILSLSDHSHEHLAAVLADSPLKPFWVAQAQALLFFSVSKTALLAGRAKGHGFLITRLPTSHPTLIKFSAPLFLTISYGSFGLSVGRTTTCSFVACMGKTFQERLLARGRRSLRGLDAGLLCGASLQERADFLTMNCAGGRADTVGVSSVSGGIFDLSLAGGSVRLDAAKNAEAYGAGTKPREILDGSVPPPAEMQPLYAELSLIVHQADAERPTAAPSRVSASLERYSTGADPDRALVLNDGTTLWTHEPQRKSKAELARRSV